MHLQSPSGLNRVPRSSYRRAVEAELREAILSGELAPGEHLNEVAVARMLGVSATPVREAFRDLEQAGLIAVESHRGATVRVLSTRDLAEMYSLRAHLERMGTRLARGRLTEDDFADLRRLIEEMEDQAERGDVAGMVKSDVAFHRRIMATADHKLLLRTWEQIHPSQWTYVTVRVLAEKGPKYIAKRHWPLLEALQGRSASDSEEAMASHIDLIGREAVEVFGSMQGPSGSPT